MADKKISALPAASTPLAGTEVLPIVQGGTTDKVSVANLTAGRTVSTGNLNVSGEQTITGAVRSVLKMYGDFAGGTDVGKIQFYNAADEFLGQINITNTTGAAGDTSTMDLWVSSAGTPKQAIVFEPTQNVRLPAGNLVLSTAGKGIDFSANTHAPGMTSELLNWYEEGTWTPVLDATTTSPTVAYSNRTARYTRVGRLVTIHAWINISSQSGGSGNAIITGLPFTSSNTAANISVVNLGVLQNIDPGAGNLNAAYVVNNTTTIALAASPQNTGGWSDLSIAALSAANINIMLSASYLV